jgi:hypothetical protein
MDKTEKFIAKAILIHKDKYTYAKAKYVAAKQKIIITCKDHGDFEQSPNNHLNGYGCQECAGIKKHTTESFITAATKTHGNKYSYDNVHYINFKTKISIWCNRCSEYFYQRPGDHISGKGHVKCSSSKTTSGFVEEATAVHGNKYEYDLVDYKHSEIPVTIGCKTHGFFSQTPHSHLKGYGCYTCGRLSLGDKTRMSKEEYLTKARETHGDKFDYSLMKYVALNKHITIVCPAHGEFTQRADGHLKYGCEQCYYDEKLLSQDEFITKAKAFHGDRYDYSNTVYVKSTLPVEIICKEHGMFKQIAGEHMRGSGCPICKSSRGEIKTYYKLKSFDLNVIREYKLPNNNYRYDFYIPELNILIEYDGIQHFKPVDFFGGEKAFEEIRIRDNLKNEYAALHKVILIRVPYTEFDTLTNFLRKSLMQYIKYKKDGLYFRNFLEFCRYFNLPGDATPKEYKEYLFSL